MIALPLTPVTARDWRDLSLSTTTSSDYEMSSGGSKLNTANLPPVTIVVPIYADLPTLTSCIDSLKRTVDLTRHRLLLINDCGPEADKIEESVLSQIKGWSSIRYHRNERNLGFVGTCNRAVAELDTSINDILLLNSDTVATPRFIEELSAVLHLSPLHGIVSARSNNALFASLPYRLRDPYIGHNVARAGEVYAALSNKLSRYNIVPVVHGFCMLVRRELIRQHGLFDNVFTPGYYEEFDFCLRMNDKGYSSIIANHAFVYHVGARSFRETKASALSTNQKVFWKRYPFFGRAMQAYLFADRDPVDVFADALLPADEIRRIIVDIDYVSFGELPYDTSTLLAALQVASDPDRFVVSLSVPDGLQEPFAAQYPGLEVIAHSDLIGWEARLWDVAVASADSVSRAQLIRLNWLSPRWVFTSTGFGELRSWRKRATGPSLKAAAQDAVVYADGVIALHSEVSAEVDSQVVSAMPHLLRNNVVESEGRNPNGIIREIVDRWGRSTIDIERLRARWDRFASYELYGFLQHTKLIRRLVRWAEYVAPGSKNMIRKVGAILLSISR